MDWLYTATALASLKQVSNLPCRFSLPEAFEMEVLVFSGRYLSL